jgi:hypothetical protein
MLDARSASSDNVAPQDAYQRKDGPMTDEGMELLLDSLQRRMATMHSLYYQAVSTMSLEDVNHFERQGVLPIAFSLFHYTNMADASFMMITGVSPIWNERWQERVRMAINDHGKHRTVEEMVNQRIGDFEAFKDYQREVFTRTELYLGAINPLDFRRVLIAPPYPEVVASTYSARCAGPAGITVLDGFECWIYQHGLRHMGEIELARGLVGLGGMTS